MKKALPGSGVHIWLKHMSINSTHFQDTSKTSNKDAISTSIPLMEEVEGRILYLIFARHQIVLDAEARQLNRAVGGGTSGKSSYHSLCKNYAQGRMGNSLWSPEKALKQRSCKSENSLWRSCWWALWPAESVKIINLHALSKSPNSQGICHCPKRHPLLIYNQSSIRGKTKPRISWPSYSLSPILVLKAVEVKVTLGYVISSRPAWAICDLVIKK